MTAISIPGQQKDLNGRRDDVIRVAMQWASYCEERGATITDSVWAIKDGSPLEGQALAGTLASTLVHFDQNTILENTITLDNGETLKAWWRIEVSQ